MPSTVDASLAYIASIDSRRLRTSKATPETLESFVKYGFLVGENLEDLQGVMGVELKYSDLARTGI